MKEYVSVAVANSGIENMDVETLKTWTPTNISKVKDSVYFKVEGVFYSMRREDYIKVFN